MSSYILPEGDDLDRIAAARVAAQIVINDEFARSGYPSKAGYDLYVVWFCKTLQNWKALVSTTLNDHKYYEVTHNGDKHETYVDVYLKMENRMIPDAELGAGRVVRSDTEPQTFRIEGL